MVALPGFYGDGRVFEPLAAVLRRPLIALDLPEGPPRRVAREVAARLAPLGPVHLLTGSWGGLVVPALPPERILSWATVGTLPDRSLLSPAVERLAALLHLLPGPLVEAVYARRIRARLLHDGVPDALVARLVERRLGAGTIRCRTDAVLAWDVPPWPPVPTAWVIGRDDPEAPWSDDTIRRHVPHASVLRVPGRHRPWASHPEALGDTLHRFWEQGGPRVLASP